MRYVLAATALLLAAAPASAATIDTFSTNGNTTTLSLISVPPPGNQPLNAPCIICGTNQPNQFGSGIGFNNYEQGGNIQTFLAFSTQNTAQLPNDTLGTPYSRALLLAFLASQNAVNLNVGIDVNTATGQGAENLLRFAVLDVANHVILSQFIGPVPLPTNNNGNGFPDYLLTGFDINRADLNANSQIMFFASWNNASDGAESFFLVPQAGSVSVPGPIVGAGLPGLMTGCLALVALARRRKRTV